MSAHGMAYPLLYVESEVFFHNSLEAVEVGYLKIAETAERTVEQGAEHAGIFVAAGDIVFTVKIAVHGETNVCAVVGVLAAAAGAYRNAFLVDRYKEIKVVFVPKDAYRTGCLCIGGDNLFVNFQYFLNFGGKPNIIRLTVNYGGAVCGFDGSIGFTALSSYGKRKKHCYKNHAEQSRNYFAHQVILPCH